MARHPDAANRLRRMTTALTHRGPDGEGSWVGPDVALGHTRLAIIDVDGGHQPMWGSNGTSVVVFNGEIYNYADLRARLSQLGYVFRTQSDTEVIWAAVDAWGINDGLLSLRGMFAFALYDTRTRRLLLARDRVGIKPLYWAELPGGGMFGSEQKALLAPEILPRRLDAVAVHDYLGQGYPTTPSTCWKDIRMLEPGTWLEIGPNGQRRGRYWQWEPAEPLTFDVQAATAATERILLDAARSHLIADVPVGAFLSGGLDSSILVTLLSPAVRRGLPTFHVGFGDPDYDESQAARSVAEARETDHHEIFVDQEDGDPDLFQRILDQYDEPFGDSSCIPVFLVCREMRQHVKVVLSGDGGDEILGGYPRYLHARRLAALAPINGMLPFLRPLMVRARHRFPPYGRQLEKAWRLAQMEPRARLASLQAYFSEEERAGLYQGDFAPLAQAEGPTSERLLPFLPAGEHDPAQQLMTAEMRLRLHADYLRKVDIASSAHGVEVRVPYLDNSMLDLAAQLPIDLKISRRGETKVISRRLARQLLPAQVAARPKMGFSIPLDRWMGPAVRDFVRSLLLEPKAEIAQLLSPQAIERVWTDFADGARCGELSRYQRAQRLFFLASLQLWLRRWNPTIS